MKTILVTSKMIIDTVEKTLMNHCAFCTKSIFGSLGVAFDTEHGKYRLKMSLVKDHKSISFSSCNTYSDASILINYSDGKVSTQAWQYGEEVTTHEFMTAVMCDVQKNLEKMLLDNVVDTDE